MIGLSYFLCRAIALQPCQELSSRIMQLFSIKQSSRKMLFPLQLANWSGVPKNDATRSVTSFSVYFSFPEFRWIVLPQNGCPSWSHPRGPSSAFWCSWGFQERERCFGWPCQNTLLSLKGKEGEEGGLAAERVLQLCQTTWMQWGDPCFGRARAPCHLPPILLRHFLQSWCIIRI